MIGCLCINENLTLKVGSEALGVRCNKNCKADQHEKLKTEGEGGI